MHEASRILQTIWTERDTTPATTIHPPLYRGSTVLFNNYEEFCQAGRNEYPGISYGTDRLPTQRQFEEALRELEGGALCRVFPSGIHAVQTALSAFVGQGDHLLLCDNAYGPSQRFCRKILPRFGVESTLLPPDVGADILDHLRPNTRVILLESPGSLTFELQDIQAITAIARERGIVTMLDASWATPLYLKPLALGVDLSIHSVSKYIGGYSDILAGAVTVSARHAQRFADYYKDLEIYTPAEICSLALRGLHSLATRLRRHEESAITIARWLQGQPGVGEVLHPAFPEHPQHWLWRRDFSGSSGLFAFTLTREYSDVQLATAINALQLFAIGYSWGGSKSLITASRVRRNLTCRYRGKTLIRLNIGLEEPEDLLADLADGFGMLISNG